jgi:CRISPR-associated protein Cas1
MEGNAARITFANFTGTLKDNGEKGSEPPFTFEFTDRKRPSPTDPVNALLSFVYSLSTKDLTIICHSVGLDSLVGFFHQPRFGRPALTPPRLRPRESELLLASRG